MGEWHWVMGAGAAIARRKHDIVTALLTRHDGGFRFRQWGM